MMEAALMLVPMLLAAHWVADYPLQGDFLASAKQNGPLRVYHLVVHAGIHGGAVALVTGSLWLGFAILAAVTLGVAAFFFIAKAIGAIQ